MSSETRPISQRRRERDYHVLLRGRERLRSELEPFLGPICSLERANNIAQGLLFEDSDVQWVLGEMLRELPRDVHFRLAAVVEQAFRHTAETD